MIFQDAYDAAQHHLDETVRSVYASHPRTSTVDIVIASSRELDGHWEFSYQSRSFLAEGDINSALAGNGPVIVPKSGDAPYIGPIFSEDDSTDST